MKALFLHERDARVNYLEVLEEARRGRDLPLSEVVLLGDESWQRMLDAGIDPPSSPPLRTTSSTSSTPPAPPAFPRACS